MRLIFIKAYIIITYFLGIYNSFIINRYNKKLQINIIV